MNSQEQRAKVVAAALRITENTAIAPSSYERRLLEQYVVGELVIDEVIALLAEREQAVSKQLGHSSVGITTQKDA